MSFLDKVSIQGIRSFGPEERNVGTLKFLNPITIILGDNGCGKTTIIETLRYITTGEYPPGVKGGQFAHDVDLRGARSLYAKARLFFYSIQGQKILCMRTMESKKVPGKSMPQATSKEQILSYTDKNGVERSINNKVLEINSEMSKLLGVSPPMLSYVIFCHQEDSTWPLGDDRLLKQRFDAIFDATKYTDLIQNLKNVMKEKKKELNDEKLTLLQLQNDVKNAKKIKQEHAEDEKQRTDLMAKREKLKTKREELENELREITGKLDVAEDTKREIGKLRASQAEKQEQIKKLEKELKGVTDRYSGSKLELKKELDTFDSNNVSIQEMNLLEDNIKDIRMRRESKIKSEQDAKLELSRLQDKEKSYKNLLMNRNESMNKLAREYGIAGYNQTDYGSDKYKMFMRALTNVIQQKKAELDNMKSDFKRKEEVKREEGNSARKEQSEIETKMRLKDEEAHKCRLRLREIEVVLEKARSSQNRLSEIGEEIQLLEESLQSKKEGMDEKMVENKIVKLKEEKKNLAIKETKLNEERDEGLKEGTLRTQVEVKQADLNRKQKNMETIVKQHKHVIAKVINIDVHDVANKLGSDLTRDVSGLSQELKENKSTLQSNLEDCQSKNAQNHSELENVTRKIVEGDKEIEQFEDDLLREDINNDIEDERRDTEQVLEKLRNKEDIIVHSWFKKETAKSKKKKPCCPMCKRDFKNKDELEKLSEQLERVALAQDPTRTEQEIKQMEKKLEMLVLLKGRKDKVEIVRQTMPDLKNKKKDLTTKERTFNNEIKHIRSELEQLEQKESDLRSIEQPINNINQIRIDCDQLQTELTALKSKMKPGLRDLKDIDRERKSIGDRRKEVESDLERMQTCLERHKTDIQTTTAEINDLKCEQLNLQKTHQNEASLITECENLRQKMRECERDMDNCRQMADPIRLKLGQIEGELRKIQREAEAANDKMVDDIQALESKQRELLALQKQWIQIENSELNKEVADVSKKLDGCRKDVEEIDVELKQLEGKRKHLEEKKNYAVTKKRQLQDQLDIMEYQEKVSEVQAKIDALQLDAGQDAFTLKEHKRKLSDQLAKKQTEEGSLNGQIGQIESRLKAKADELEQSTYKNVQTKHNHALIDTVTTQRAIKDIDIYIKALDVAILKFHGDKMKEINEQLDTLWSEVYKGEDISTIKIVSESDDSSSLKRYNYRVVKVENGGIEKDMRGQCSAGQKVLACLLIRMALAEVFCANCGVLTLDEPTTNLDHENIDGLGQALSNLVASRREQANFQLMVITHDKQFVNQLIQGCDTEFYYKISKDVDGFSIITKKDANSDFV